MLEAPYEDVPEHLFNPLWSWVMSLLDDSNTLGTVGIALRIEMPEIVPLSSSISRGQLALKTRCDVDSDFMLDLVQFLLENYAAGGAPWRLNGMLSQGNSVYTVNDANTGLEMRVAPGVKEEVQAVVDAAAGSPGDHLATAWNEAYGRTNDPVKAYSEAIKAVESAAAPIVSPSNLKATLGTILKDIVAKPSKWKFEIDAGMTDGVEVALDMMRLLWGGQTSRHGGVNPTRPETDEEARAAVHLAATLVQWCVSRAFSVS